MDEESVVISVKLRKLAGLVNMLEAVQARHDLERPQAKAIYSLQHSIAMARRLANEAVDSELGAKNPVLVDCTQQLDAFRTSILKSSEYDLISAIDVAQLSAMADEIIGLINKERN